MKKLPILGALVLTLAGVPVFAHGGGGGGGGGGGCGHGGGWKMLRTLDLTADQKQAVKDVMSNHRARMQTLAANERAAREAIASRLYGTATVTQQDLDPLVQQAAQARTDRVRERLAVALEIRALLTPAQIEKASTVRTQMQQLRSQMRALTGKPTAD